jgi:UDP-glucose 4-epimerase
MARRRRVLVTGVARWWGALTARRLADEPGVAEVVGIDVGEPGHDLGGADFVKVDIRHSLIGKLVRSVGIDTVVHTLTTIDSFDLDPRRAHETNVIGTLNLLAGCSGGDSPVRRVVLKSSGHVYGSGFDLPAHLREDRPLAAGSPHAFVRDMVEVESRLVEFAARNPEVQVLVLRFANSLNPDEPQPLARYLDLELVPTVAGYDPTIQLVHRDDCVEALVRASLRGASGAYNVAAPRPLPLTALLDAAGKLHAPLLPPLGLGLAAMGLRRLGIAFLSPQLLDLLRWGRSLATARAERGLGFRAARDTEAALVDFVRERRVIQFRPDRSAYQYERELEEFIHSRRPARARAQAPPPGP